MNAQIILQLINIVLSIGAIVMWIKYPRSTPVLRPASWWIISLLVSNTLFSMAALLDMIWLDFISNITLNYWGQGVRIQAAATLFVCSKLFYTAIKRAMYE